MWKGGLSKLMGTRAEDTVVIVMKALGEDLEDIVRDMVRNWEKWHLRDTEHVCEKTDFVSWTTCRTVHFIYICIYFAHSTT